MYVSFIRMQTITITISYYRIIDSPLVRQSLVYGSYLSDTKVRVADCLLCPNLKQYRIWIKFESPYDNTNKIAVSSQNLNIFLISSISTIFHQTTRTYTRKRSITNQIMNEYISFIFICPTRVRKRDPRNS